MPSNHKCLSGGTREAQKSVATAIPGNRMKLQFEPNQDLLGKVKSLPNRTFVADKDGSKYWVAVASPASIQSLVGWGFQIDDTLHGIMESISKSVHDMKVIEIEGLGGTLRPFQMQGVAFLEHRNGKAIIGDDMGSW